MPNVLTVKGIRRLLDGMGDNCVEVANKLSRVGTPHAVEAGLPLEWSFEEE